MALFSSDSWVGTGCIDQSDHRHIKLFCHFHQAHRFAIAFRVWTAEITLQIITSVTTFLLAKHHYRLSVEESRAAYNGSILLEATVTMELLKIGKNQIDVIKRIRAFWVPGELHSLPCGQIGINILLNFFDLGLDRYNFTRHVHLRLL